MNAHSGTCVERTFKNIINSSGFIIGTLAGVIVSFLSYLVYDYWFKAPKLVIEYTDYYRIGNELYIRVKIRNDGRVVAQNCQCYLRLVGEGVDPPLLVEGSLCWSLLGNPHSISINPKSLLFAMYANLIL